jgi:hypothetical protein
VSVDGTGTSVLLQTADGSLTLLDLRTGRAHPVAAAPANAGLGAVTRHGRAVVFTSPSADLVPGDTNGVPDVFVRRIR